jgi:hypothetical protein
MDRELQYAEKSDCGLTKIAQVDKIDTEDGQQGILMPEDGLQTASRP